jgi:hypothetical protein
VEAERRPEISGDLTTEGGEGQSLVKGVQVSLKAIAEYQAWFEVGIISVGGQVRTAGDNVITVEIDEDVGQIRDRRRRRRRPTPFTLAASSPA